MSAPVAAGTLAAWSAPAAGMRIQTDARFCSSCGAPLERRADENDADARARSRPPTSRTSSQRYLEGLPPGVGLLVVRHGPNAGSSFRLEQPSTPRRPPPRLRHLPRRHHGVAPPRRASTATTTATSLRDVGSLNGTYVNRERVDEARLRHGDEVQIGRYRLSFVLGGERRDGVSVATRRARRRSATCSISCATSSPTSRSRRSASSRVRVSSIPSARRRATASSTRPTSSGCASSCASSASTSCR